MPANLTDDEWRALFEYLRAQVSALGFGDWDHHAALALDVLEPRDATTSYLRAFVGKQKRATNRSLEHLRTETARLLTKSDGERVTTVLLVDDRFERDVQYDLFGQTVPTDQFVDELAGILAFLESGDEGALR